MKIKRIEKIELSTPMKLIDIGVEGNHTFFVNNRPEGDFVLTHNSYPDIDCLINNTKVMLSNGVSKEIQELEEGDLVFDINNQPKEILKVVKRISAKYDQLYCVFMNIKGIYGSILANHKHRMITEEGSEVKVEDLKIGDWLKSKDGPAYVLGKEKMDSTDQLLVDITVEDTSTFAIIPFNVICKESKNHTTTLISINNYSIDTDDYKDQHTRNRAEISI